MGLSNSPLISGLKANQLSTNQDATPILFIILWASPFPVLIVRLQFAFVIFRLDQKTAKWRFATNFKSQLKILPGGRIFSI
jgi:hypothetical protein